MKRRISVDRVTLEHLMLQAFRYSVGRANHLAPHRETFAAWLAHIDVMRTEFLLQAIRDCAHEDDLRAFNGQREPWHVEAREDRARFCAQLTAEIVRRGGAP